MPSWSCAKARWTVQKAERAQKMEGGLAKAPNMGTGALSANHSSFEVLTAVEMRCVSKV